MVANNISMTGMIKKIDKIETKNGKFIYKIQVFSQELKDQQANTPGVLEFVFTDYHQQFFVNLKTDKPVLAVGVLRSNSWISPDRKTTKIFLSLSGQAIMNLPTKPSYNQIQRTNQGVING